MSAWTSPGSRWTPEEIEKWKQEQQVAPSQATPPTQSGGDPWVDKDPWGGRRPAPEPAAPAAEPAAPAARDLSAHDGTYMDPWQADAECTLTFAPGKVLCQWASTPDDPPDEGTCDEKGVISLYKQTAEIKDGEVRWSNGGKWVKKVVQAAAALASDQPRWPAAEAQAAAAPANEQTRWGGESWAERPPALAPAAAEEQRWGSSKWDQQPSEPAPAAGDAWAQPAVDDLAAGTAAAIAEASQDHQRSAEPSAADATSYYPGGQQRQSAPAPAAAPDPWATDAGAEAPFAWVSYSTPARDDVPAAGAADDDRSAQHRARWRDFTAFQEWNIKEGILSGKSEAESSADEARLFQAVGSEGIDFSLYDGVPCEISGPKCDNIPVVNSFEDIFREFGEYIPESLAENVRRCGYKQPTPVQKCAIPPAVVGRDIMCCAQTGSGKTAAFLVPTLSGLMKHGHAVGAHRTPFQGPCKPDTLILSPTRELCVQIFTEAEKFFHNTDHRAIRIYGQDSIRNQIEQVAKGADLIVATPGRLYDFVDAKIVDVTEVSCLVFDEADRMMQMQQDSFMREIVDKYGMPDKANRQTMMFSATFPEACQKMAEDYLFEHIFIGVGVVGGAAQTVTQTLVQVAPEDKYDTLIEFIDDFLNKREQGERMLVFTNSKAQAKGLDEKLFDKNFDTGALHGDLRQQDREANLEKFRKGEIDVMIATDVASRGLDISGVSQVVNFDLPFSIDVYVQRIGRTGRIGHRGKATTFIAVGKDGEWHDSSHEQQDTLRAIPFCMRDAGKQDVPKWLEDKIVEMDAGKSAGDWNSYSARTDARAAWQAPAVPQDPATDNWTTTGQNNWVDPGTWASDKRLDRQETQESPL